MAMLERFAVRLIKLNTTNRHTEREPPTAPIYHTKLEQKVTNHHRGFVAQMRQ